MRATDPAGRAWPEGWAGPWWVAQERRAHPGRPVHVNRAGVRWTEVGALAGPQRLLVDGRGYVVPDGLSWGIDWWVGADDRWHVPSSDTAVRQSVSGVAPVVQTALRVPSGDVVQRVAAVAGPSGARIVVEISNDSPVPVALALALRPVTLRAVGALRRVELRGGVLLADGAPALLLDAPPSRCLLRAGSDGDPLPEVEHGGAGPATDGVVECPDGLAGAVLLVPLAHRATLRWQLPLAELLPVGGHAHRRAPGRRGRSTPEEVPPQARPVPVPPLDAVERGWGSQIDRRLRLDLPPIPPTVDVDRLRGRLLLGSGAGLTGASGAEVAVAAATAGFGGGVEGGEGNGSGGETFLRDAEEGPTALGMALWATARCAALGGALPRAVLVADTAERLAGAAGGRSRRGGAGLAEASPEVAAGLAGAAVLLGAMGERRAATEAAGWAREAASRWDARLLHALPAASGAAPHRGDTAGANGVVAPADLLAAAVARSATGDPSWPEALTSAMRWASPTGVWADRVDVATGDGSGVTGEDHRATARWWLTVRSALVGDAVRGSLEVLPSWPWAWVGAGLEVHRLPTAAGALSFALRWHGARPALLWSLEGAVTGVRLTVPALDPTWSSSDVRGEALFPEPVPPPG